ncbi:MAG: Rne/Rng family ribonuclease [Alphaproteobacteria bacterium]|nr:Rne/Rng family ribonuclease [Alphaproteobacteria bacterium]
MVKRMLIDATHPEETRVVVVNGNKLEEFDFETATRRQLKGNVYLAKITRVEPSLQSAFVEYGGNRHGFLAFNEVHPDYYRLPVADREALLGGSDDDADEDSAGANGADEDVETVGGDDVDDVRRRHRSVLRNYKIQEVLSRRQILLVQVTKEERGNKGATLTTFISLAGRYCVLMPNTPRGGGISRKITNPKDRRRLKAVIDSLDLAEGMAVILRTAGMERTKAEIKRDHSYLVKRWEQIRSLTMESTAPALIHEEANLIRRSIRDIYSRDIEEILVEGDEGYRTAKEFMRTLMPSHAKRVQPYKDEPIPLFHRYQVESEIDSIHDPVVQLRSGGYIIISPTEALVAIDVNSGRATRERNIEETALRTNIEAAEEVARQLSLRDLAGLIVIDFIDMEVSRNRTQVEKCLKEAMRGERARVQLGRISPFGLLELSRQRLRPSLVEATMESCVVCGGTGHIRSTESTGLHVLRAIEDEGIRRRSAKITIHVPTEIALYILNQKRDALAEIERRYKFRVTVAGDASLIPPDLRLERSSGRSGEEMEVVSEPASAEAGKPEEIRGQRRSRRRGRGEAQSADTRDRTERGADDRGREESAATEPAESEMRSEASGMASEDRPRRPRRRGRRGGRNRSRRGRRTEASGETSAHRPEGEADPQIPTDEQGANVLVAPDGDGVNTASTSETGSAAKAEPARRRSRKRAEPKLPAETKSDTEIEAAGPTQGADETSAEEKPKARRRTRRPRATSQAMAGDGKAAEKTDAGAGDDRAEAKTAPKLKTRRRAPRKAKSDNGAGEKTGSTSQSASGAASEPGAASDASAAQEDSDKPAARGKTFFSRFLD